MKELLVRLVDTGASFFAAALLLVEVALFASFVRSSSWWQFAFFCAAPYVVPLLFYRLVTSISPLKSGGSRLAKGVWSTWFITYRLQSIYLYFPFLEAILFAIPGGYSMWLRLWGSRVGNGVQWAGTAFVADRGQVSIGAGAFIGHGVYISGHVMQKKSGLGTLYIKPVSVGAGAFVGTGCRMGPGVVIHEGARVPILTDLYVREEFPPREEPSAKEDRDG